MDRLNEKESLICSVCLERIDENILEFSSLASTDKSQPFAIVLKCSHIFHAPCILNCCPVCRKEDINLPFKGLAESAKPKTSRLDPRRLQCNQCNRSDGVQLCLVCGYLGCTYSNQNHALMHSSLYQHYLSLHLESNLVNNLKDNEFLFTTTISGKHKSNKAKSSKYDLYHDFKGLEITGSDPFCSKEKNEKNSYLNGSASKNMQGVFNTNLNVDETIELLKQQLETQQQHFQIQLDKLDITYQTSIDSLENLQTQTEILEDKISSLNGEESCDKQRPSLKSLKLQIEIKQEELDQQSLMTEEDKEEFKKLNLKTSDIAKKLNNLKLKLAKLGYDKDILVKELNKKMLVLG